MLLKGKPPSSPVALVEGRRRATAQLFIENGARVAVLDLDGSD
jgi:hypothetical protein